MADNLRPYGPGKFNLMIDAYVYDLSQDGTTAECGESATTGWYGCMEGALYDLNAPVTDTDDLTADERAYLAGVVGAIVSENSQGFVNVEYFDSADALKAAWDQVMAEVESLEASGDEEEEEEDDAGEAGGE